MVLGAEEAHHAVLAAKGLEPVEHGLRVVQDGRGGIQGQRSVRLNTEVVPAPPLLVGHDGHVIGKDGPEAKLALIRLRLAGGGTRHGDRLVHKTPRLAENGTVLGTGRISPRPAVHSG